MRAIRFRLDRLMIWVAVAAVNLAAFRVLFATRNIAYLAGGMIAWIMIQAAIFRAIRNRRGKRPYWLGFAAGGSVATLSMASISYHPGAMDGSIWMLYNGALQILLERAEPWIARLFGTGGTDEVAFLLLDLAASFLPLWLAAVAGGHLFRMLFTRRDPQAAMT